MHSAFGHISAGTADLIATCHVRYVKKSDVSLNTWTSNACGELSSSEGRAGIPPFAIDCDHDGLHPLFSRLPQPVQKVDYNHLRTRAHALPHNPAATELFKYHFAAHQREFPVRGSWARA